MKFIEKLYKFMYGRYGVDELYKFLFWIYILLIIINIFVDSSIIVVIELIILFIMFYRFFSKKINKRKKENKKYLNIKNKVLKPFDNIKRNIKDKEHVYVKCSKCKKSLKLDIPMERGIKTIKCPNCKNRFKRLVLKKVKVEIITRGK